MAYGSSVRLLQWKWFDSGVDGWTTGTGESFKGELGSAFRFSRGINKSPYSQAMYPSAPPDAYNKFSAGAPPTAPPPPAPYQHATMNTPRTGGGLTRWSTGLFHCMDDPGNCLITCVCPCITFGQIADIVDKGACPCLASGTIYSLICASTGLGCLYSCFYRSKLRAQYDLDEGDCPDFLVHFCCEYCALCQEYRELKNRGFDMGIGWSANMDRQRRGVTGAPVMGAPAMLVGMTR